MPGIRLWQLFEFESEMLRSIQLYNALSAQAGRARRLRSDRSCGAARIRCGSAPQV